MLSCRSKILIIYSQSAVPVVNYWQSSMLILLFFVLFVVDAYVCFQCTQTHDAVRADILQQILNRVVVKATSSVAHYLGQFD